MPSEKEKIEVNHEMVNVAPEVPQNPYDDALAFRSLLGAINNELETTVNKNIVSPSAQMKRVDSRYTLEKGVKEILKNQRETLPIDKNFSSPQPSPANQPQPTPVNQPQPAVQQLIPVPPEPSINSDQLELNFDNSATAQDIFNKIDDLEIKINKILHLLTNDKKKRVVKK